MRCRFLCALLVGLLFTAQASAANWFKLGDSEFSARLAVTVTNPADADNPAVLVTMSMAELGKAMPEATAVTIAVADETHTIVPFQIARSKREYLNFVLPVKAKQSRTVYVYAAKNPVAAPKFAAMTGSDSREAWRSFENDFTAFRIEVGAKAKTTGLAIDIFGKSKDGHGAQLKNIYASDYHERQPWGIDVMKVGTGPGLGGAYIMIGDKIGRTSALTTKFRVFFEGPIATSVEASGPVEVDGKKFTLRRTITCQANDRALDDTIEVDGDGAGDVKIGVGLRDLPNQKWVEKTDDGYAFVHGDGNQKGTAKLGLGIAFDPKDFDRVQEIEDKSNGGRIYIFTPDKRPVGSPRLSSRLLAFWDGDGWINNPDDFDKTLSQYARTCISPSTISIAEKPETR